MPSKIICVLMYRQYFFLNDTPDIRRPLTIKYHQSCHLTQNFVFFQNINTMFEIGIVYISRIEPSSFLQMVTATFDTSLICVPCIKSDGKV